MTISKSVTQELDSIAVASGEAVKGAEFVNLMKRINGQEELIKDAPCKGSVTRSHRGHTHGTGGTGRGIMRMGIGSFQSHDTSTSYSYSYSDPSSMANAYPAYTYEASAYPTALNFIMGKAYVSAGVTSIGVEVLFNVESVGGGPMLRVKNLSDTTNANEIIASSPIALSDGVQWYGRSGQSPSKHIVVPVVRSSGPRTIDLDIEVFNSRNDKNTEFFFLCAFPFEFVDEL